MKRKRQRQSTRFIHFVYSHKIILLLIGILCFTTLLKINNYTTPHYFEDGVRDFMIARHILEDKQPAVFSFNDFYIPIYASPMYYYTFIPFLLISTNLLHVGILHIIVNALFCLVLYKIGELYFNRLTGFLGAVFFAVSQVSFDQSRFFIWQIWQMQYLVFTSYMLILISFRKSSLKLLWSGLMLYIFTCGVYNPALLSSPLIFTFTAYFLVKKKISVKNSGVFLLSLILFALFIFSPTLYYLLNFYNPQSGFRAEQYGSLFASSLFEYIHYFQLNTFYLFDVFLPLKGRMLLDPSFLVLEFFLLVLLFICIKNKKHSRKIGFALLFLFQPILIASFFHLQEANYFFSEPSIFGIKRYFTGTYSITLLLFGFVISLVSFKNLFFTRAIQLTLSLVIILLISPHLFSHIHGLQLLPQKDFQTKSPLITSLTQDIKQLRSNYSYDSYNFFTLYYLGENYKYGSIWNGIEQELNTSLIKLPTINQQASAYKTPSSDDVIFVICGEEYAQLNQCEAATDEEYPIHKKIRSYHLLDGYSVVIFRIKTDPTPHPTEPSLITTLLTDASNAFSSGEFEKSILLYQQALDSNPTNPQALVGLANVYRFLGRYEESEQLFLKALEQDPSDSLYADIGKLYRNMNEQEKALTMFQKAVELNPTNAFTYSYGLGYLYRDMGEFKKAEEMFLKAVELDPLNDFHYMGLGDIYRDEGKFKESEEMFLKALSMNPQSESYLGLGFLYLGQQQYEKAEKAFNGYLENLKPKGEIYVGLGYVYLAKENLVKAEEMFQKSIELNKTVGGYGGLSQVYGKQGNIKKAAEMQKLERQNNPQLRN